MAAGEEGNRGRGIAKRAAGDDLGGAVAWTCAHLSWTEEEGGGDWEDEASVVSRAIKGP